MNASNICTCLLITSMLSIFCICIQEARSMIVQDGTPVNNGTLSFFLFWYSELASCHLIIEFMYRWFVLFCPQLRVYLFIIASLRDKSNLADSELDVPLIWLWLIRDGKNQCQVWPTLGCSISQPNHNMCQSIPSDQTSSSTFFFQSHQICHPRPHPIHLGKLPGWIE